MTKVNEIAHRTRDIADDLSLDRGMVRGVVESGAFPGAASSPLRARAASR